MATGPIVKHLQLLENGLPGLGSGPKGVVVDAFLFDRSEKALHQRIIVTSSFFAHAHLNSLGPSGKIAFEEIGSHGIGVIAIRGPHSTAKALAH